MSMLEWGIKFINFTSQTACGADTSSHNKASSGTS